MLKALSLTLHTSFKNVYSVSHMYPGSGAGRLTTTVFGPTYSPGPTSRTHVT